MLSFIIPAYNEANNIANVINSINTFTPEELQYEIIVIDHGSLDNTRGIASELGASVYQKNCGTVAQLRNYGVEKARGDILIFLDADVVLTSEWRINIIKVIESINNGCQIITGSWVSIPDNASWIEKCWFKPLQKISNTHVNSGHMITSSNIFKTLGGFQESLVTGEDYELSMRAKRHKIIVSNDQSLKVIHEGFPKTLGEFIRREFWHGKGDVSSLKAVISSKVALISIFFSLLQFSLIISLVTMDNAYVILLNVIVIGLICLGSSYMKYKHEPISTIFINSALYYLYFLARSGSLLAGVFVSNSIKRER
jgi:glycosyltransferase involved in cell wall biosynthesis